MKQLIPIMKYFYILFFTFSLAAQQTKKVDFIQCDALVQPDFSEKTIKGKVTYTFEVLSTIDTIRMDAIHINFKNVIINNKEVAYQVAHKMKPTIELFGLNYFDELLTIQNWGNKTNTVAKVNSELSKVQQSVTNASTELRKDFNL